jgi:hypothetical protein
MQSLVLKSFAKSTIEGMQNCESLMQTQKGRLKVHLQVQFQSDFPFAG